MTDSTPVDMEDLDAFEAEFFGNKTPVEEPEAVEEKAEDEEVDENEDNSLEIEDEDEASEEDEEDEEPEEEPKPKKNRKSFKERIDEVTAEKYAKDAEIAALRKELEALKTSKPEVKDPEPVKAQLPPEAPDPDAIVDGKPVYPLGEFDPTFIRDLTKFTIEQETKAAKERAAQEAAVEAEQKIRSELTESWVEKVAEAEKEIPELRQNIAVLGQVFGNIDPNYGDYLAMTIMSLDDGPAVMNYLSQNIGEAQKIVASGPAAATLAIGRLEARLAKVPEEKRNTKKVSEAPPPPDSRTRGSGGKFTVAGDTDDLDAFERVFFNQK